MNKIMHFTSIVLIFGAAGCATVKTMEAVGGSRADGTVDLAYEYGLFEVPEVQTDAAYATARQRCAAWGYQGAEPFGGSKNTCMQADMYGSCVRMRVTVTFQCTS